MSLNVLPMLFLAENNPVPHAVNHLFLKTEGGLWLWSAHQGNLVLSGLIMLLLGPWLAKKIGTGPESMGNDRFITTNVFAHMVEVICTYLRDTTVRPLLGRRTDKFMPFLWTIFFFILVNNLLGMIPIIDLIFLVSEDARTSHLVPIGGTATQNIAVTGVLAFASFLVINIAGIKEMGISGYLKHLTGGAPVFVWPLMILIEVAGIFIKPVALAIRLFANMTAGHILLATIFMFVGMALDASIAIAVPVTLISIIAGIAVNFLELFVSFLQAFVFMFLSAVFISMLEHHGHEHDEYHAEAATA